MNSTSRVGCFTIGLLVVACLAVLDGYEELAWHGHTWGWWLLLLGGSLAALQVGHLVLAHRRSTPTSNELFAAILVGLSILSVLYFQRHAISAWFHDPVIVGVLIGLAIVIAVMFGFYLFWHMEAWSFDQWSKTPADYFRDIFRKD